MTTDLLHPAAVTVLAAALQHRPVVERLLPFDCYMGNCDHADDPNWTECAEIDAVVCAACYSLAQAIDSDIVPDEVLAGSCPVCVAVTVYTQWTP